eukprot:TRINITY_DN18398_c0_g1_i1.p1 TRINITY_DN18398_c0_g1~~TRINITY_DN18398_c0_g1_i1.p1  ORF type:complete len:345 (-),score=69.11 TRINITY_DN18398_c0_g1_i1:389-1423(-)
MSAAAPQDCVIVENGDTLCTLSERFGIDWRDLKAENKLKDDFIMSGEVLKVPKRTRACRLKTKAIVVEPGDTAWGITDKFGLTLEDLKKTNGSIPEVLFPGDVLHLPADAVEQNRILKLQPVKARPKGLPLESNAKFFDVFPPPKDIDEYRKTHRSFLNALRYVESSNILPAPKGDGGMSIGPLQISADYHTDAWWLSASKAKYEHVEDVEYAERTAINYWLRYCPWALEFGDLETLARTHNGGPSYWRAVKTSRYWRRVRNALLRYGPRPQQTTELTWSGLGASPSNSGVFKLFEKQLPLPAPFCDGHDNDQACIRDDVADLSPSTASLMERFPPPAGGFAET